MSLRKNTFFNLLGFGLPAVVGIISVPILVSKMGLAAFGVFTLIGTVIGYLSIFDLGLGTAITQQIAARRGLSNTAEVWDIIRTGLWSTVLIGSVGGLSIFVFSEFIATNWLGVNGDFIKDAHTALIIAAVAVPITTATSALRGVQEGFENFRIVNILRVAQGSLNFVLPIIFIYFVENTISSAVLSILLLRIAVLIGYTRLPGVWSGLFKQKGNINLRGQSKLFSTGAWITTANIVSPLMVTCDRFFVSSVLGASLVSVYTIPLEALLRILIIPSALSNALFPKLSMLANSDREKGNIAYRRAYLFNFAVLFLITVIFCANAELILRLWISSDFARQAKDIFVILTIGIFFNGLAHVPYAAIQARGGARATAILRTAEAAIYVPSLLYVVTQFGLSGVACAWAVRALVDLIALHIIEHMSRSTLPFVAAVSSGERIGNVQR